ncbi:MAG: hypothetical protein WCP06_10990 [Verrucomicrobiota bacterium]
MFLISAVVLGWAKLIDQSVTGLCDTNLALEARALAHSGIAVARHAQVTRMSPQLKATFGQDRSYEVTITGEGGKLNLNYLLRGEDPVKLRVLKQYLERRGLTLQEREILVDCLLDWVGGAPNTHHLNGATDQGDYKPPHRQLISLDEVAQVKGSEPLVSKPNWKDDFTIYGSGRLDLEWASAEFLSLVGIAPAVAERFVKVRQGPDGKDGTKDDHIFKNDLEAFSYLGIVSPQQRQALSGLVVFHDPAGYFTIRSIGKAANLTRQVEIVAQKNQGANSEILQWTEK